MDGITQISCECRDAATPGKIIPHNSDSIGECWARRSRYQGAWRLIQCERLHLNQRHGFGKRHYFRQRHSISCESMTCGRITAPTTQEPLALNVLRLSGCSAEEECGPMNRKTILTRVRQRLAATC